MQCLFCFLDLKVSASSYLLDLDVSLLPVAKNNIIFEQVSWKDRILDLLSIPEYGKS